MKPPLDKTSCETHDQHEATQQKYWQQLREELLHYKETLGATNSELSEGLSISRQPLVSFMQGDRSDLPIQRSHLTRLWEKLTSPQHYASRRLSKERLQNRQALRKLGSSRLLRTAGFSPGEESLQLDVEPERYQQIQRIVSGLSNISVQDDSDFIDLISSVEREIVSKVFGLNGVSSKLPSQSLAYPRNSESAVGKWLDEWMLENLGMQPAPSIGIRFKRAVYKLIRQGKYNLSDREVFELYLSILENSRIDSRASDAFKIRITQCQFSNLNFSILDLDASNDPTFREDLIRVFLIAEAKLRFTNEEYLQSTMLQEQDRQDLERLVSDVVTEASVTCSFTVRDATGKEQTRDVCWRYSSSATHFENMFTAIYKGMGCEEALELVDFSTASLGKRSNSLVKSSTVLKSKQKGILHQGVWVDSSAVVGTAQSVVVAIKSWLIDNFSLPETYYQYYKACTAIAEMDYSLKSGRKCLSDYVLQKQEEDPIAAPARDYLRDKVIFSIRDLNQEVLSSTLLLKDWYGLNLERKYCWAQLACARSALVEGDIQKASDCLRSAETILSGSEAAQDVPLAIRLKMENMLWRFYGGDRAFIEKRAWRLELEADLQRLQKYVYEEDDSSSYRRYCGRLDESVYLCASEIFARVGRLDFTFSTVNESQHLMKAANNLLMAAYYSSKVGESQRTAHWLANASRTYCRLGEGDKAKRLANIAERVISQAIDQRYSAQYKEAIMAEIYLSRGEAQLLIDHKPLRALHYFGRAIRAASYLGFVRLLADSLYNVARAAENLDEPIQLSLLIEEGDRGHHKPYSQAVRNVEDFLLSLDPQRTWLQTATDFKRQSQQIWHQWAVVISNDPSAIHPVEEAIEKGVYLQSVR